MTVGIGLLSQYHSNLRRPENHVNLGAIRTIAGWHFRGVLKDDKTLVGQYCQDPRLLPPPEGPRRSSYEVNSSTILCHAKPKTDPFVDIPDRLDIYLLLRYSSERFGFVGDNCRAMISKSEKTWQKNLELRDWELNHPYRRSRLVARYKQDRQIEPPEYEIEESYAKSALKGIGLVWPGKPYERHRDWPKCLRAIGLDVTWDEATTIKYVATVFESRLENGLEVLGASVGETTVDGNGKVLKEVAEKAWGDIMDLRNDQESDSRNTNYVQIHLVSVGPTENDHTFYCKCGNERWFICLSLSEFLRTANIKAGSGPVRNHRFQTS